MKTARSELNKHEQKAIQAINELEQLKKMHAEDLTPKPIGLESIK
jgi:hypothetical protein